MLRFENGLRFSATAFRLAGSRRSIVACAFLAVLSSGCGGGDDGPADVPDPPPDLTGNYDLVSFSAAVTGGATLTSPAVSGTLTLQQSPATGSEATGNISYEVQVPDGEGGVQTIADQGTYTVRSDGSWEQQGRLVQGIGTWSLSGSTLAIQVTEPALAVSTLVWRRR